MTIDLSSSLDTYLYLRAGSATSGTFLHDNDDIVSGNTNAQIVAELEAGTYTAEATTRNEAKTGSFTLNVSAEPGTPVVTDCTPTTLTLPASGVSGAWANDCQSSVSGRGYARYYTFTLDQGTEVTIDLTSEVNTYLYLRSGSATSGTSLHSNDDIASDNTNSQIVADLEAGSYTIEATTHDEDTSRQLRPQRQRGWLHSGAVDPARQRSDRRLGGRLPVQRLRPGLRPLLHVHPG